MTPDLTLRQKSAWNGFDFEFVNAAGSVVGDLAFVNVAQAKNARLAVHPKGSTDGDCKIVLGNEQLLFRFEYTRRGFNNDVRYTLETLAGHTLCTADVVYESGKRHPTLRMSQPLALEVLPSTAFWTKRFPIVGASAGAAVGTVHEPRALALRFEYGIHLPGAPQPVRAFLLVATYLVRR
ncbi:MAG TPA: hypothetical protein PK347_03570 [Burkholderiaceae bacterium]|nr:hypothetical protein [Burkholderiaceae bacterium]